MEPSVLKIVTVDLDWLRTLMGTKQGLLFWFRIRRFLKIWLIGLKNFFPNCPRINAGASTLPWTSPAQRAMGSWLGSPRILLPAGFSFQDVEIDQLHRDHFCSAGLIVSSCFCTAAVSANALDCPPQPQGQQRFETRRASIAGGLPDRRQSSDHLDSIADRRPSRGYILYESTYPPKLHFRWIQYVDLPNQEVMS
jgi:hypothetical protein